MEEPWGCGGGNGGSMGGGGWLDPGGAGGWSGSCGGGSWGGAKGAGKGTDKGWAKGSWKGGGDMEKGNGSFKGMTKAGGNRASKGDGKKGGCKGKAAAKIAAGEPVYHGQVKSFSVEKKHGYIACEGIYNLSGQDVYAFQDVLERGKAAPGDTVAFFVHWSSRGQPQASSPMIRLSGPGGSYALKGTFKQGKDAEKGFGFIECAETKEFFGRDVYVNKDMAAALAPGQFVAFSTYLNRDGMPNVHAMEPCDETWEATPGDLSVSLQADIDKGKGKGCKRTWNMMDDWSSWGGEPCGWDAWGWEGDWWGYGPQSFMALPGVNGSKGSKGSGRGKNWAGGDSGTRGAGKPTPTGQAYTGMIRSFNEANHYGFIECEEVKAEYGFDVFLHGKELRGQAVGDTVYFEVGVNSKGQPQALNVQSVDPMAIAMEPSPKKPRLGTHAGPSEFGEGAIEEAAVGASGGSGGQPSPFQDFGTWGISAGTTVSLGSGGEGAACGAPSSNQGGW